MLSDCEAAAEEVLTDDDGVKVAGVRSLLGELVNASRPLWCIVEIW